MIQHICRAECFYLERKLFGAISSQMVLSTVDAFAGTVAVYSLTAELLRISHRYYTIRNFRDSAMRKKIVGDHENVC